MEMLLGIMIAMALIGLLLLIFFVVCLYKIYVKCGLPGWHAIIPCFNFYSLASAIGMPVVGIVIATCTVLGSILSATPLALIGIILYLPAFICCIVLWWNVCAALGFPGWMSLVVMCVPIIGLPIVAFAGH